MVSLAVAAPGGNGRAGGWYPGGVLMTCPQRSEVGALGAAGGFVCTGVGLVEMTWPQRSDVCVPAGGFGVRGGMFDGRVVAGAKVEAEPMTWPQRSHVGACGCDGGASGRGAGRVEITFP